MEISIDSRSVIGPRSDYIFCIKGKNHDGHDYVQGLYERGVRDFVISEKRKEFAGLKEARFYEVENVLEALQEYAGRYRREEKS